ncbi:cytochrome c3 family protein [bacterium]|nr:cytochrome c3 family protein [bacterium]
MFSARIYAKVTGRCDNCHTMHNSQNGIEVDPNGPYNRLLKINSSVSQNPCVACHSSSAGSTYYDLDGCKVPVVLKLGAEPTVYLAGGNFWWVKEELGGDDTKGHNVFLNEDDENLSEAPGGNINCVNSCHKNLSRPYTLSGGDGPIRYKYGCEGCHYPRHHANDHPNGQSGLVDIEGKGWYRFLAKLHAVDGPPAGRTGVKGYEDGVWEAGHPNHTAGTSLHNEYQGNSEPHFGLTSGGMKGDISGFCTGCHRYFSSETNPQWGQIQDGHWIRHPSDSIIPVSGEFSETGGASHLYDPLSPVAKGTVDETPDTGVTVGLDMVMCLSCHRPHGSPYPDMLRWDYTQQLAGGGGLADDRGCFYCHTKKNE